VPLKAIRGLGCTGDNSGDQVAGMVVLSKSIYELTLQLFQTIPKTDTTTFHR
jgi:hypothetical protein